MDGLYYRSMRVLKLVTWRFLQKVTTTQVMIGYCMPTINCGYNGITSWAEQLGKFLECFKFGMILLGTVKRMLHVKACIYTSDMKDLF